MIRLLLYAAAVALASASTAMIHDTIGSGNPTLSAMFGKDFCFVEDPVWTPKGDKHVILYDSCILRITIDMTGKIDDTIGTTNLGVERDGCTVRYHPDGPDGRGHGWVYRGAMKWKAVLIPYKNAVHVSVIGHRDNACTLEFMPTSGSPVECPENMCPKRFFPITQGTTGKNDKRCCEECTSGVCHRGFRLKESLDMHFNKEDECCEKLADALKKEGDPDCAADEYPRDLSKAADGTLCKKCPVPCPSGQEPNREKKPSKVGECCKACTSCESDHYKVGDGTTCCKKCECDVGKFVNSAIAAKTSEAQCCKACPTTCPSGQEPKVGAKSLGDCCKDCPTCGAKQYMTGDDKCCGACDEGEGKCGANKYYKTEPAASKAACCGACAGVTCKAGQKKTTKTGPFDSEDQCCEASTKNKCEDVKCGPYLYNEKDESNGQCCKACDITSCGKWQTLNPEATSKEKCCKALTTAEFCAADQFACPSSMYPKAAHSKKLSPGEITVTGLLDGLTTVATHKNTSLEREGAEKMTEADAANKQAFCCEACKCEGNQVKKPFPTTNTCCEDCGECTARQYIVLAEGTSGHNEQKDCCKACTCTAVQYYKEGKNFDSNAACCGDCTCDETWQKLTTAKGPFDSKDKCCVAKTWKEYCTKDMCHVDQGTFPRSEFPSGNVDIGNNAEGAGAQVNDELGFKSELLSLNMVDKDLQTKSCCEGFEAYCGEKQNECKPSQYKIHHMSKKEGKDGGTPQCCKACPETCPSGKTRTEASIARAVGSEGECCEGAYSYCSAKKKEKDKGCAGEAYLKATDFDIKDGQVTACCEVCPTNTEECGQGLTPKGTGGPYDTKDECCVEQKAKEYCGTVTCDKGAVKHESFKDEDAGIWKAPDKTAASQTLCCKAQTATEHCEKFDCKDKVKVTHAEGVLVKNKYDQDLCCADPLAYCQEAMKKQEKGCTKGTYLKADIIATGGQVDKCCEACPQCPDWQEESEMSKGGQPLKSKEKCCTAKTCATAEVKCESFDGTLKKQNGKEVIVPLEKQKGFANILVTKPNDPKCCRKHPLATDDQLCYVKRKWELCAGVGELFEFTPCSNSTDRAASADEGCAGNPNLKVYKPVKDLANALNVEGVVVTAVTLLSGPIKRKEGQNTTVSDAYKGLAAARAAWLAGQLFAVTKEKAFQIIQMRANTCSEQFFDTNKKKQVGSKKKTPDPDCDNFQHVQVEPEKMKVEMGLEVGVKLD